MKLNRYFWIITVLVFVCIYGFLIAKVPWNLVFLDTIISGGDTGSHSYVARYSREIFPKLKWWSPDWYAGFPFLYFYPPLLYYFADILSFIIPLNVAFKLITLLGTFLLPLAIYLCLRLLEFDFPIPSLGAFLSLAFLFLEKFSIYGGNLPSTLAGEFSYSFGFALFFIFIGLLFRDLKQQKTSLTTILTLALMALVHPFSVIVAVLAGGLAFFASIITKKIKSYFLILSQVFGLAFGLTAFWSLPFLALLGYTSRMSWTRVLKLEEIFPRILIPFEIIAGLALIYALFRRDKKILPLVLIMFAALIPFFALNHSSIWNTRFLPFILMVCLMFAAYGLGQWFLEINNFIFKKNQHKQIKTVIFLSVLTLIFSGYFIFIYLPPAITYIPFWMKWNYEGFENKNPWPETEKLFSYLKTLPPGRIMWEYRGEYDKFGTPRILENLPIWTNHPTFEGLLIESSVSGYFHFINQAETTQTPTAAIAGMKYPSFNFENGAKHIQLFGAQYFLAYTPEVKSLANQYFTKLADIGDFSVYQVPDSELVVFLPDISLQPKTKNWLDKSLDWYKKMDFSRPLVFYQNKKELQEITTILQNNSHSAKETDIVIKEIKKDSLIFETENLYQPHLVKISYFPGWKVIGGKGPYLVSPAFMMVIPTEKQVILKFGYNLWDKIGAGISIISLVVVCLIAGIPYRFLLNRRQKFSAPLN